MLGKNGILRISRFYDITHETVVTSVTDFGIHCTCTEKKLNKKCSGLMTLLFSLLFSQ